MYLEPADSRQSMGKASRFGMRAFTEKGNGLVPAEPRGYNEWFPMVTPVAPIGGDQFLRFGAEAFFAPDIILPVGEAWSGNVYIDDILIK